MYIPVIGGWKYSDTFAIMIYFITIVFHLMTSNNIFYKNTPCNIVEHTCTFSLHTTVYYNKFAKVLLKPYQVYYDSEIVQWHQVQNEYQPLFY